MPTRIVNVDSDVLVLMAECIVLRGEGYWLACTCRTMRNAVRTVCHVINVMAPNNRTDTIFCSLTCMHHALSIESVKVAVLAHSRALNCYARPKSLDGRFVWSPAGERAMIAGAPPAVLDYAWPSWRHSVDTINPACALAHASRYGRIDLLRIMDSPDTHCAAPRPEYSLYACLEVLCGREMPKLDFRAAHNTVVMGIMSPALQYARFDIVREWFYQRMEQRMVDDPRGDPLFRRMLDATSDVDVAIDRLACDAARGVQPFRSLRFLVEWMWPNIGSRARCTMPTAALRVAAEVLCVIVDAQSATCVGGWEWLEWVQPEGLHVLLSDIQERSTSHVRVASLIHSAFNPHCAEAYAWLSARVSTGQWCDLTQLAYRWPTMPLTLREGVDCTAMRSRFAMHAMACAEKEFNAGLDDALSPYPNHGNRIMPCPEQSTTVGPREVRWSRVAFAAATIVDAYMLTPRSDAQVVTAAVEALSVVLVANRALDALAIAARALRVHATQPHAPCVALASATTVLRILRTHTTSKTKASKSDSALIDDVISRALALDAG